jgi:hypothetical protein
MISDAIIDPMDVEIPDGEGGIIDIVHVPPLHGGDAMNVDCPACALPLSVLARSVPRAHHSQSAVVCAISGAVMDADNPPLAFPNGYVYSRQVCTSPVMWNDMLKRFGAGSGRDGSAERRSREVPALRLGHRVCLT